MLLRYSCLVALIPFSRRYHQQNGWLLLLVPCLAQVGQDLALVLAPATATAATASATEAVVRSCRALLAGIVTAQQVDSLTCSSRSCSLTWDPYQQC
jgi:hypothetical protein